MKKTLPVSLLLIAALPALAQEPSAPVKQESLKGVVRKNLAPVSNEVLRVKLPRPVVRKLKNGLTVLILENHRVPSVTLDLLIPASPLSDPAGLPGVAEATASMLNQGTATRSALQIATEVSEMGAMLNIVAQWGTRTTSLNASALAENLDPMLALVGDVLLHPTFPDDELGKWKKRRLSQLQQARSQPGVLAMERMNQVLYAGDARALMSPTPESVEKIGRQDLVDFHKKYYVAGSSILGVTGDITPEAIMAGLEKHLGAWSGGVVANPDLAAPKPPLGNRKIYLVNRPSSVQTFLVLANHAIDRLSPDYVPCTVMNRILGSGPSSRLFINIREEKGFTYGVYSQFAAGKYIDAFGATSSVRTEVTAAALDEFLKEFRRIREEPVPTEELENAKRAIVANFALSIENQASVLRQRMVLADFGLPAEYWDTYAEKVMAVTAADVQRVARKYVPLDNVQIVAVGDGAKIKEVLARYGPVEEYDIEGKKAQ